MKNKKVIKIRTWNMEVKNYDDGTSSMERVNTGFSPFELLGIVEMCKQEILEQMKGNIQPDVVKRTIVEK